VQYNDTRARLAIGQVSTKWIDLDMSSGCYTSRGTANEEVGELSALATPHQTQAQVNVGQHSGLRHTISQYSLRDFWEMKRYLTRTTIHDHSSPPRLPQVYDDTLHVYTSYELFQPLTCLTFPVTRSTIVDHASSSSWAEMPRIDAI